MTSPVEPHYASGSGTLDDPKSPLTLSLGFLKGLTEKKTTKGTWGLFRRRYVLKQTSSADGQPPKRRGPKPDSKPAMTRRQELNRQAQRCARSSTRRIYRLTSPRTHRERKELYIKALEQEVQRLKETFSAAAQDRHRLADENAQLKALLAQHGIAWTGTGGIAEYESHGHVPALSTGSTPASYAPASSSLSPHAKQESHSSVSSSPLHPPRSSPPPFDIDQAGIDFVLTYGPPSHSSPSAPPTHPR